MGKEEASRTDVTLAITDYIRKVARERHCTYREVYENIASDVVLNDLIRSQNKEVSCLNVNKFLNLHFPNREGIIVADEWAD